MDEPLLSKMQTLMEKYQQSAPPAAGSHTRVAPAQQDTTVSFPVLTDIVKLGDAVFRGISEKPHPAESDLGHNTADEIAQQILRVIDTQLQTQVDMLVTPRLQRAMDEVLATLLPQLMINIESIIRETLVQEFSRHGISLSESSQSDNSGSQA